MLRNSRLILFVLLSLAALAATACGGGGGGNPADPSNTKNSTMSATLDGASWNASATVLAVRTPALPNLPSGTFAVTGSDAFSNYTLVTFAVPAVVGTYQLGSLSSATAAVQFLTTSSSTSKSWSSVAGASGTIELKTLTATAATGTFSFNLAADAAPATGTKVVTNGKFDVKF